MEHINADDWGALGQLSKLEELRIDRSNVQDLNWVNQLPALRKLSAAFLNSNFDISAFQDHQSVESIDLTLSDVSSFASIRNVETLERIQFRCSSEYIDLDLYDEIRIVSHCPH